MLKKYFFIFSILLFSILQINAQEVTEKNTSFDILLGGNFTLSEEFPALSSGGDWGAYISHFFADKNFGFSTGINYMLLHFDLDTGSKFVSPSEAISFEYLETPFLFMIKPLSRFPSLQVSIGASINLHLGSNRFNEYQNVIMSILDIQKVVNTKSNLSFSYGLKTRYFSINRDIFGQMAVFTAFIKMGIKS